MAFGCNSAIIIPSSKHSLIACLKSAHLKDGLSSALFKEIFSDSSNIFVRRESKDIGLNKKKLTNG